MHPRRRIGVRGTRPQITAGASPRPTGNGVPSSCCRTGKLLDKERETHPELWVKGTQSPCRGSGTESLRRSPGWGTSRACEETLPQNCEVFGRGVHCCIGKMFGRGAPVTNTVGAGRSSPCQGFGDGVPEKVPRRTMTRCDWMENGIRKTPVGMTGVCLMQFELLSPPCRAAARWHGRA